jgi:hypothetical protein
MSCKALIDPTHIAGKMRKPSYLNFDHNNYYWKKDIDYRAKPELYKVGKGEQGVLICEPYKSEIGQHWRFKTPEVAEISSTKIFSLFLQYLKDGEFVGADMARKYLQMGFTRSRRYANYKGGKKYEANNNYEQLERGTGEVNKAISANIFYKKWQDAESDSLYKELKRVWKKSVG